MCGLKPYFSEEDQIGDFPNGQQDFDEALVRYREYKFTRTIMQSGYKTIFCRNLAKLSQYSEWYLEKVQHFKQLYSSQPLSLQRLAANAVRNNLYPNAVVGSRVLGQVQPGEEFPLIYSHLVSYIMFGLTQENVEKSLDGKWTQ